MASSHQPSACRHHLSSPSSFLVTTALFLLCLTVLCLTPILSVSAAPGDKTVPILDVPLSPTVPADGRFAPRHSFSAPFSGKLMPNWDLGAGAVLEDTHLRLTPAKQSRTGFAWNTQQVEMSDWEVLVEFNVKGRADYGGDGFAVWFVERPQVLGTVYGSTDYWNGLMIAFDSYNNDGSGPSPVVSAILNDGTLKFDGNSDGASQAIASCGMSFRNLPYPALAKIRYSGHLLTLDISTRKTKEDDTKPYWQNCFRLEAIELGVDKYFGLTAHTGDVADSHDITKFEVHDLSPAQVDLKALREKYQEELHHQQSEHEHGHQMTDYEFQHAVLNYLMQIQGEVNLLETGQIEVHELVLDLKENGVEGAPGGAGGSTGGASRQQSQPYLDPQLMTRLNTLHEKQQNALTELEGIKSHLSLLPDTLKERLGGGGENGGQQQQQYRDTLNNNNAGTVSLSSSSTQSLIQSLKDSLDYNTLKSDFLQMREKIASIQNAQQSKMEEIMNMLRSQQGMLASMQAGIARSGTSSSSSSSTADVGWLIYTCIIFSTAAITVLVIQNYQQAKKGDRWKLG